jgi:phenylacetic acid degradation operon negative regulatory protein
MSANRNVESVSTRPFTARSVIASTLLGTHPPVLPARILVRSGLLFDIPEGTIRVALNRMVGAGELRTSGDGRYELMGHLRRRQRRQDESRQGVHTEWDGSWELVVIGGEPRAPADRAALRLSMKRLRLVERREGVWMRPRNLDPNRLSEERESVASVTSWFTATPNENARQLTHALWDLESWATDAKALIRRLESGRKGLDTMRTGQQGALGEAFTLSADTLRHLQADPLLPQELLPKGWPGAQLRERFESFDQLFQRQWRTWLAED